MLTGWLEKGRGAVREKIQQNPGKAKRFGRRVVEVATEIGVLLIVFGPLETLLKGEPSSPQTGTHTAQGVPLGWLFFAFGVILVIAALVFEWSFDDDNPSSSA